MACTIYDSERLDRGVRICAYEQAEDVDSLTVAVYHDGLCEARSTLEYRSVQPNMRSMKQNTTGMIMLNV